jgi:TRAP transporter TAXI family solute receptor
VVAPLGALFPEALHIVVPEGSDIRSVDDLDGHSVSLGPEGSLTRALGEALLEARGVEAQVSEEIPSDALDSVEAGRLDALFWVFSLPAPLLVEQGEALGIRLLDVDDAAANAVLPDHPGLYTLDIPAGTYPGQGENVAVLSYSSVLYANTTTVDDDLAYDLVRALYENAGDIGHGLGAHILPENALNGIGGLPLHPGAERYYREQGVM